MSTVVVTGADRGIGAALCQIFAARGDHVFAACLEDGGAQRGIAGIHIVPGIDVSDATSVAKLIAHIGPQSLDIIVNNAGVVFEHPFGTLDYAALHREYAVNALGPLRVTEALRAGLRPGSKVAIISSRVGSLGDNGSGGLYGYRMSKAAANMAGVNLAHELRPLGVAVICLHPGSVRTVMTQGLSDQMTVGALIAPEIAAQALVARIDELDLDTTGRFRHANGEWLPW